MKKETWQKTNVGGIWYIQRIISYRQIKKNIEDMGYKVGIIKIQKA